MKLRNKQSGEIEEVLISAYGISGDVAVSVRDSNAESGYQDLGRYKTLAELNEEWEDYKEKEPLIKDKKIRKAVRAWAEALGLQEVYCASNGYEIYGGIDDYVIQFEGEPFPFADKNKIYAIAELCGEEEE